MEQNRQKNQHPMGSWRVTALTSMLFRLEFDPARQFENRISQIVVNRDFPETACAVSVRDGQIRLSTDHARIHLEEGRFRFSAIAPCTGTVWHYGEPLRNLGGTARTLDTADGAIPLEDGIFSEEGIGVLEDNSCLLDASGEPSPRPAGTRDVYLFLYGRRFAEGLRDFYRLCGKTPLLPRYALGNWWSRFWPYTQQEYLALMDRFDREKLPFSVAVLDMDWHLTRVPEGYSGWTGYTWNRDLIPNPGKLLSQLHHRGKKVTLNLHPADGVQPFEEGYPRMAEAMGLSPEVGKTIPFDFVEKRFRAGYFDVLLRPMEREGVDFWWIDWQQGTQSKIPGLDPLWLLNHYHFLDAAREGRRPLILSRYAGPGSHRYPVGFSGDTVVSWESLRFQPYFTATAANIGYGWWSHDIGGHMNGIRDDELACRWVQFGVFSPINRLHSTCNRFAGKEPWRYRQDIREIMGNFLRLRHQLIPYLYAMNHRSHAEGIPLVRPMYHGWPQAADAYRCPNQYEFGSQMIAAPAVTPCEPGLEMAGTQVWLPEGTYYDFFTHVRYQGGRWVRAFRPLSSIPVFVKAGGIVPMAQTLCADENPQGLLLRIYPGSDGQFLLYEDDGAPNGAAARTEILLSWQRQTVTIRISGAFSVVPENRQYTLCFCGMDVEALTVRAGTEESTVDCGYVESLRASAATLPKLGSAREIQIRFHSRGSRQDEIRREELFRLLQRAQMDLDFKEAIYNALEQADFRSLPGEADKLPVPFREALEELLQLD